MYIISFLLIVLLLIAAYVILMPIVFLRGFTRWLLSRFGFSGAKYEEMRRAREEQMRTSRRREETHRSTQQSAPRNSDGKIFSADEGEYVEFEEIK